MYKLEIDYNTETMEPKWLYDITSRETLTSFEEKYKVKISWKNNVYPTGKLVLEFNSEEDAILFKLS